MTGRISHDRAAESPEAKAAWFQSLSLEDRMELLCAFTDLVLENNPDVRNRRDVRSITGRVRIVSEP